MVAQRRLRPLGVVLMAGLAVVALRTFQVQVVEHEVWAVQAQSFLRNSRLVPYHRGEILDRNGRLLVQDEDADQLEFVYRDFRRRHPLGLVTHARSAIEMRPVPLTESVPDLEAWALALVALTPAAVAEFARGGALVLPDGAVLAPAAAAGELEARGARAQDLRFYVGQIAGVERREAAALRKRIDGGEAGRGWLDLLAAVRGAPRDLVRADLLRRVRESLLDLRTLAEMLEQSRAAGAEPAGAARADEPEREPFAALVELLEARRSEQEDDAADDLFRAACGFGPGRVPTEALRTTFDLSWIAAILRWDAARLEQWAATRRAQWERELDELILPRILVRADLCETEGARAQRLLDGLASLWRVGDRRTGEPTPWTSLGEPCVLHEADSLFETPRGGATFDAARPVLPFQDEDLRALAAVEPDPWRTAGLLFEMAALRAGLGTPPADAIGARWAAHSASSAGLAGESSIEDARRAARVLEAGFSAACLRVFAELRGAGGPLALAPARIERARQRERFVLVDVQSRSARLPGEPSYALVHLVTRDPERYAGFGVRATTRRRHLVLDAEGEPCAGLLIGGVRRPMLREILAQAEDERRLARLQFQLLKSEEEERELRELATRLARPDEWTGDGGLEGWFDAELRGRYGLYETEGLEDAGADGGPRVVPAIDGQDLVLTIDSALQLAAQDVLARPEPPPGGDTDLVWFENPVGAIVLLSTDGEVLAAASTPGKSGLATVPGRGRERSRARERTLQAPTFNPPGSVFKPFVAAYAVDRLAFDPRTAFDCVVCVNGHPGFGDLRCNATHVSADLHHALAASCNAYFAQLGLRFTPEQFLEAAQVFGFGEPTGIRAPPGAERSGLFEDWRLNPHMERKELLQRLATRSDRLRFPNGLGLPWATPMQVARATAGLATGVLPEVRVVRSVGGVPLARASRPLGLSAESLRVVREGLAAVVREGGSAHHKRLEPADLGFTFACKTGSADIGSIAIVDGMPAADRADAEAGKSRKHTWVAGWFPADAPRAVVVVYLHNVTETASRTAVHVTSQFLRTSAVKEWALQGGAR